MHRSRVGVVLVDHPESSYAVAATFWSAAVGREPVAEEGEPYESLGSLAGGLELALQRLGGATPARVHLDLESDDVAAEVARLTGLGAVVVERLDDYAVLADPGGVVFCVVPVQSPDAFERHATTWE